MLLKNISNEFIELKALLNDVGAYDNMAVNLWRYDTEWCTLENMLKFIPVSRMFVSQQHMLKSKTFESKSVKKYIEKYLDCLDNFIKYLDTYINASIKKIENNDERFLIRKLKSCSEEMYIILNKIYGASEIIEMVSVETWEPLPSTIDEDEYKNVIILSESKNVSLSGISKDISALDNFLNYISSLINEIEGNNFYLRKVESGSLAVVISCVVGASQIVSFIFLYIKLYQNTEKRELKNKERKLELINKSLDSAKKILELDPQNTEANEIIQKCGLCILEFLENNPKGTINDQSYDIGAEKLKIDEKKED